MKNIFLISMIFFLNVLSKHNYAHEEFLKYGASLADSTGGIDVFTTSDPFHDDLLHWSSYNIKVHPDWTNRAPNIDGTYWTEEDKNTILFTGINHWDQWGWDEIVFTKSSTVSNSVPIVWSTDARIFPEGGDSTIVAYTIVGVQDNKIVYNRTDAVPEGHYAATGVIFNNTANNGFDWTMQSSLMYSWEESYQQTAVHEFGHVLGLAHCSTNGAIMEPVQDSTRSRYINDTPEIADFQGIDILFNGIIDDINDGINIFHTTTQFNTNFLYSTSTIEANHVDNSPYGNYIVTWEPWTFFASNGCDYIQISQSTGFYISTLPSATYNWERDASGYVKGKARRGGTDNDGDYHFAEIDIEIMGVPYDFILSGTLTASETYWCGNVDITGTITVPAGKTLTVSPYTFVNFNNNARLNVYGTLNIEGTEYIQPQLDFISKNSNGIYCYSGSSVNIDNAEIINAYYGVYTEFCSPTIKNSSITNAQLAIRTLYSKPTIENCNISECYGGIYIYYTNSVSLGDPLIKNNIIEDFTSCAIYLYQSTAHIRGNEIKDCWRGIYGNYSSTAYLGEVGYYGNNKIYNNDYGIYAYNNTYMLLGRESCETVGGNNSVFNNTYKNAYSTYNGSEIQAANTWWGSSPPNTSKFYVASGCTLVYTPYLTSNPLLKIASNNVSPEEVLFNDNVGESSPEKTTSKTYHYDKKWPLDWKILYLRNLVMVKDYKFAQKICEEIINNYPDSSQAITALSLYQQSSKSDKFSSFIKYLQKKVDSKKTSTLNGMIELCLLDLENVELKNTNKYERLVSKYEKKEMEETILFHDFTYNLVNLGDHDNARKISDKLTQKFKNSELAIEAQRLLGDIVDENNDKSKSLGKEIADQPDQYELLGNYPNPFNPSTRIKYATPFISNINLEIYDISGSLVKSFEINSQSPGHHEILWDGRNISGSKVASGIYFYKLKALSIEGNAKSFEKTAKFILMK